MASCSMIKQPTSSNFNRVKYNAHIKKSNSLERTKVASRESFEEKDDLARHETKTEIKVSEKKEQQTTSKEVIENVNNTQVPEQKKPTLSKQVNHFLEKVSKIEASKTEKEFNNRPVDWWEDDPEDWPWGEIVLAVIAILVIAILIVLFIDLIGAVVGSILGLILLILLAYLLYQYWV